MNVGVSVSTVLPFAGARRLNPAGGPKSAYIVQVCVESRELLILSMALTDQVWVPSARVLVGVLQVLVMLSRTIVPSTRSW